MKRFIEHIKDKLLLPLWFQENNSLNKIFKLYIDYCSKLPNPFRTKFLDIGERLLYIFVSFTYIFNNLTVNIFKITGEEKHSKKKIKLLYIGKKEIDEYIISLFFNGMPIIEQIGISKLRKIKKYEKKNYSNVNLIVVDVHRFYRRFLQQQDYIFLPKWISLSIDLNKPLDCITKEFSASAKKDIKRIRKMGYSYSITKDLDDIKYFYTHMYRPYTLEKHGKLAEVVNYEGIRNIIIRRAFLMYINLDGRAIAGSILRKRNKKLFGAYLGISDDGKKYYDQSLISSIYYFNILYAKKHGLNELAIGKSRPFLNDSGLQFKKKWNIFVYPTPIQFSESIAIKITRFSPSVERFLLHDPFIYYDITGKLQGAIFLDDKKQNFSENEKNIRKKYAIYGLDKKILTTKEFNKLNLV